MLMKQKIFRVLFLLLLVCSMLAGCKKSVGTPEDNAVIEVSRRLYGHCLDEFHQQSLALLGLRDTRTVIVSLDFDESAGLAEFLAVDSHDFHIVRVGVAQSHVG